MTTPALFDAEDVGGPVDPVDADPVGAYDVVVTAKRVDVVDRDAVVTRARVCHPSGTPRLHDHVPEMTAVELRDQVAALSHQDLVAVVMALCTGMYPRIARDSVIAELARTKR